MDYFKPRIFSRIMIVACLLVGMTLVPEYVNAIPSFPGAQGMGANSVGGRGGTVYIVDTLSDNPDEGMTFREAAQATGPRIIVFAVSGIIDLNDRLMITTPYITIAGETSPGGILVSGWSVLIETHDVIMRHIRIRNGCQKCYAAANCSDHGDALSIYGLPKPYGAPAPLDAYNIIVDHCSISWGCDETMDFGADRARIDNVTVSNCLIAEGVNDAHSEPNHARGLFLWGKRTLPGQPVRASFYRNLIMSFESRLPLANYNVSFDFVNNVVYNFNSQATPQLEPINGYKIETNMIQNYIKPGPISGKPYPTGIGREINVVGDGQGGHIPVAFEPPYPMIYSLGNIGYTRQTQTGDDWIVSEGWSPTTLLSKNFQRTTPFPSPGGLPLHIVIMSKPCADAIVETVGAIKPVRDSVDLRLVNEYRAGDKGKYTTIRSYPSDFPVFLSPPSPADTDHDGMADTWESLEGLNPNANDSMLDKDDDGYTNIEEYLHFLSGSVPANPECLPYVYTPEIKGILIQ